MVDYKCTILSMHKYTTPQVTLGLGRTTNILDTACFLMPLK